jgi:hypothetical protein
VLNDLDAVVFGTWPQVYKTLQGSLISDLKFFDANDFHVELRPDGTYTVTVDSAGSANPDAPHGRYTLDWDGSTTQPDPPPGVTPPPVPLPARPR